MTAPAQVHAQVTMETNWNDQTRRKKNIKKSALKGRTRRRAKAALINIDFFKYR